MHHKKKKQGTHSFDNGYVQYVKKNTVKTIIHC